MLSDIGLQASDTASNDELSKIPTARNTLIRYGQAKLQDSAIRTAATPPPQKKWSAGVMKM